MQKSSLARRELHRQSLAHFAPNRVGAREEADAEACRGSPVSGRLAGKVALITGASRGIGAAVARHFAAEGAHVVLAARTVGGLEEVDDAIRAIGGSATLVPVDLRDFIKIDELAARLFDRYGRLDILVGDAAEFGVFSPLGHIDPATWAEVVDLNLTTNWRLIRAMDPLLRAAPAGRAIFVTAGAARRVLPYWGPYAVSKAGLEMLVKIYAGEITKTRVRANLIDPGIVRTRLRARAFPGEDPGRLPPPDSVTDAFLALALPECTRNGEVVMASAVSSRPNE
jgi:NAD(P)-dependent dehydrogenase (short-subunit alcohol dehydrogenase family)